MTSVHLRPLHTSNLKLYQKDCKQTQFKQRAFISPFTVQSSKRQWFYTKRSLKQKQRIYVAGGNRQIHFIKCEWPDSLRQWQNSRVSFHLDCELCTHRIKWWSCLPWQLRKLKPNPDHHLRKWLLCKMHSCNPRGPCHSQSTTFCIR